MQWTINYYTDETGKQPVKEWLKNLDEKLRLKVYRSFELLEEFNLNLKAPYVKPLEDKLYELRIKDQKGIYRVIYFAHTGKEFIMLNGFTKKTQKTPKNEIELAKIRMKKVLNNE
ncbi:type II toxin-antitoxin system RelE/ParE family toxin [bacterium]|nr:type II toxin-antitoxin system RelE/ParE family toxin [bacterium]MBU1958389.1 type II toxin-antitoxin system RelE/ParE family toxin [bacterium]